MNFSLYKNADLAYIDMLNVFLLGLGYKHDMSENSYVYIAPHCPGGLSLA